jgi:hypothetical protein
VGRGRVAEAQRLLDSACTAFEIMGMRWHLERAERTRDML